MKQFEKINFGFVRLKINGSPIFHHSTVIERDDD